MISVYCMTSSSSVFSNFCSFQPKIFPIHLIFLINFVHNPNLLLCLLQRLPSTYNIGLKAVHQHSKPSTVHPHLSFWVVSGFHQETLNSSLTALLAIAISSPRSFQCRCHHSCDPQASASIYQILLSCQDQLISQVLNENFHVHPWGSSLFFLATFMLLKLCASQLSHIPWY